MKKENLPKSININRALYGDCPKEIKFLEAWAKQNRDDNILRYLLEKNPDRKNDGKAEVSDRDREVAATVIQWLGSPVGQFFLRSVGSITGE